MGDALAYLMARGGALPVYDSVVVPISAAELAKEAIAEASTRRPGSPHRTRVSEQWAWLRLSAWPFATLSGTCPAADPKPALRSRQVWLYPALEGPGGRSQIRYGHGAKCSFGQSGGLAESDRAPSAPCLATVARVIGTRAPGELSSGITDRRGL